MSKEKQTTTLYRETCIDLLDKYTYAVLRSAGNPDHPELVVAKENLVKFLCTIEVALVQGREAWLEKHGRHYDQDQTCH